MGLVTVEMTPLELQFGLMGGQTQNLELWRRVHFVGSPVSLTVLSSALGQGWLMVTAHGQCELFDALEAAQRAGDDRLGVSVPHDCRWHGCTDWLVTHSVIAYTARVQ